MIRNFVFAFLALFAQHGRAALLISNVSEPPGNRSDFTGTIGVEFVVGDSPLRVKALGVEDVRKDGLQQSHQVGIWNADGALLGSVTVPSGKVADLKEVWRLENLASPIVLKANTRYFLGASKQAGQSYSDNGMTTTAFELSGDVVPVANSLLAGSFGAPSEQQLGQVPRWGFANMSYDAFEPSPPVVDLEDYYESKTSEEITIDATPVTGYPLDFSFQWFFDGLRIPASFGGTESSVTLTGVAADEGNWRVLIRNGEGSTEHTFDYRVFTDTDGDGLSDGREIQVIGSDPDLMDSDSDGLSDFLEWSTYKTNPLAADSDGDGFNDSFEINTGFNPNLESSTPEALSELVIAVEFRFSAAAGVKYRIESSTDLANWALVESDITGSGAQISRFYSIGATPRMQFRARRDQ
tara:strand:- start:196 stop:1425 length:1230 start_codon:yes stop_codon:yes gene_type:complete